MVHFVHESQEEILRRRAGGSEERELKRGREET